MGDKEQPQEAQEGLPEVHLSDIEHEGDAFTTEYATYQTSHSSLFMKVIDAWKDMRKSTRRLIDENPFEGRLLFYILMSDMIFFLSWSLKAVVSPTEQASSVLPAEIGVWLIVALFARTALIYAFSFVLWIAVRAFGGKGDWKSTRAGVFWGSFTAAPFGLLFAVVTVIFASLESSVPILQNPFVAQAPYWLSLIPFVYLISAGVAEAHRLKATFPVFASMTFIAMFLWLVGLYLRANHYI